MKKEDLSDLASKRINKHNGRALTQKNRTEERGDLSRGEKMMGVGSSRVVKGGSIM